MGGVGKTTIAELLFEELEEGFDYTCFVEELKLITGSKDDVKGKIWTKMRRYGKQRRALGMIYVGRSCSCYAFPNGENPPETLGGIVEDVVRVCAGLPLTLKVLGTHLRGERDEMRWAEIPLALESAQSISSFEGRIWAVVRVSYDALQDDEKDLFLEMACTFTNDDQWFFPYDDMKRVLASKYKSVNNLLKALVEKCLIKTMYVRPRPDYIWWSDEDSFRVYHPFQMHEHLRSMGYKIAKDLGRSVERLIYPLVQIHWTLV
ncbi:hypothetical protein R1sor_018926 [Riccia sorocarpa]|uniref:NB-ARC domain-containing protein n=1 Tax=Riccia sorocarpa TaxID=122646 RepID=A0ABD3IEF0_9MARC